MIYILDEDTEQCAQWLDDRSLDKMIKTIAQTLYNVHYFPLAEQNEHYKISQLIKETGKMSPKRSKAIKYQKTAGLMLDDKWTQWALQCKANYRYLIRLGIDCCREYHCRYADKCDMEKVEEEDDHCGAWHKMRDLIDWAGVNTPNLQYYFETKSTKEYWYFEPSDNSIKESDKTTFPLLMPKKYIPAISQDIPIEIQAYRNYYQAKLKQKINKLGYSDEILLGYKFIDAKLFWTNRILVIPWLKL